MSDVFWWEPIDALPPCQVALLGCWDTGADKPYWVQERGHWYEWNGERHWSGWRFTDILPTHCLRVTPPPMPTASSSRPAR